MLDGYKELLVSDSLFDNNTAEVRGWTHGSAFSVTNWNPEGQGEHTWGKRVRLLGSNFTNNYGDSQLVALIAVFDVEVYGCRFEENSNESWNGVLWVREVQRARIHNSVFNNNFQRFGNGGALGFNEVTYADV